MDRSYACLRMGWCRKRMLTLWRWTSVHLFDDTINAHLLRESIWSIVSPFEYVLTWSFWQSATILPYQLAADVHANLVDSLIVDLLYRKHVVPGFSVWKPRSTSWL